jgi:hypothetical protein
MAIDEHARHRLYQRLEDVLGPDEATILMQHLPPVGWADVATKRDLDQLESRLEAELTAAWRRELLEQSHRTTMFVLALNSALAAFVGGIAFTAARLV